MEYAADGGGGASRRATAPVDAALLPAAMPLDVTADVMAADLEGEAPSGVPFLRAHIGGTEWLVPLAALRTVLADLPRVVPLPQAPEWLLGVFPYRAELLALVDPAPVLTGTSAVAGTRGMAGGSVGSGLGGLGRGALIAGAGERSLAWQLERMGGVVHLPESALRSEHSGATTVPTSGQRFCAGLAALDESPGTRLPVLDVDALLTALLVGLAEEDRGE